MNESLNATWPSENQISLLRDSMLRLIPACEELSENFYSRLFFEQPSVKPLFTGDMESQREKLVMMVATSIDLLNNQETFYSECAAHGKRHAGYGALPAHYPVVAKIIIEELAKVATPPLTEPERAAWVLLFDLVSEAMLSGAALKE